MAGHEEGRHASAFVDGEACPLDEAIAVAASRLRGSRQPVFAGLGCDIEGVRAVVRLAERAGGAIDHLAGSGYGRELQVVRDAGLFLTTPSETKARADRIFIVGSGAFRDGSELLQQISDKPPALADPEDSRRILWLGGKERPARHSSSTRFVPIGVPARRIRATLAALRARLAGRPVGSAPLPDRSLDALAATLQEAKFGVAIWSSWDLDALAIETLAGLVQDLNRATRFSCLPLPPSDNATGVAMALTWLTGFPSNIGFGRGAVEHDPWRFDAARLALSGEADLALWISAYRDSWPDWASQLPVIALTPESKGRKKRRAPVEIEVGRPGIDHDGIDLSAATGSLAFRRAGKPSGAPSVAEVLGRIEAVLDRPERARQ
jgi:formylmethanofuran dehydrogenase subunit B